jgi:hypothetical protein
MKIPIKSDNYHQTLVDLLSSRAALKQDVYEKMKCTFSEFKVIVAQEIDAIRAEVKDERVRCKVINSSDFEIQIAVGSDILVFHMHTNVFRFEDGHPIWKTSFLEERPELGYFGIINIYNFLFDSVEYDRRDDVGYLIGRIFINKEGHFIVQGLGDISLVYSNFFKNTIDAAKMTEIVQRACTFAVDFDSFAPPYQSVGMLRVEDMKNLLYNLRVQTGKRIGFKWNSEK